jgi:hypothetical protein
MQNPTIKSILVAIAGIFKDCDNITQQDAPHKKDNINTMLKRNVYSIYLVKHYAQAKRILHLFS